MNLDLFTPAMGAVTELCSDAMVLHGFVCKDAEAIYRELLQVIRLAPLRHMITPGGFSMSVAMSNCGEFGWITDRTGYRYTRVDPESNEPWPSMPTIFDELAKRAAHAAGFNDFRPDACLINRYASGARMSLHQDKNERDFSSPIVSVSLGLPAKFIFGGLSRNDRALRVQLDHGDVVVWGGSARLRYHGVLPLKAGDHSLCGPYRFNLTFRRAN